MTDESVLERIESGIATLTVLNDSFKKSIEQVMTDEAVAQGIVCQTHDPEEVVEAFMERRSPEFQGQ